MATMRYDSVSVQSMPHLWQILPL